MSGCFRGSCASDPSLCLRQTLTRRSNFSGGKDVTGVLHPQGPQNMGLEIRLQALAADRFHQPSRPIDAGSILPARSGLEHQGGTVPGAAGPACFV